MIEADKTIPKKYQIEFTEKQLRTIAEACEFMSRFAAGQLDKLPMSFQSWLWKKHPDTKDFCRARDTWEIHLYYAKTAMFPDLDRHESYGIGQDSLMDEANICYDIYRPILEQFSKEYQEQNPEESNYSVYDHPGLTTSKEGRIKITKI